MKSYVILVLLLIPTALGHAQEHPPLEIGESIVNAELSCKGLDKEQLHAVGLYLYGDSRYAWWTRLRTRIGYCLRVW